MNLRVVSMLLIAGFLVSCQEGSKPTTGNKVVIEKKATEDGFVTLDDGRKIRVERTGKGEKVDSTKLLIFHYKEWLLPNRRKINDSYELRRPTIVRLKNGQLTEGLEKTIMEHRIGAVFQVEIPWTMGYGDSVYLDYPPKRNVMYDVSLIGMKDAPPVFDTTGIIPEITVDGLEIYRVEKGSGKKPQKGDVVEVHYHGFFENGIFFDSSYDRETPISFELGTGQVILGWDKVLQQMHVGEKVHVKIPFFLAYGEGGRGGIPPKTDLCFDIELLAIMH